jgi:hypothetical protein
MTEAYVVATVIYIVYSISLWSRQRRYRRQLEGLSTAELRPEVRSAEGRSNNI